MLAAALDKGAASLKNFAAQMAAIAGTTATIQVQAAAGEVGDDRTAAEAIKRGQTPQTVAALKKAMGL